MISSQCFEQPGKYFGAQMNFWRYNWHLYVSHYNTTHLYIYVVDWMGGVSMYLYGTICHSFKKTPIQLHASRGRAKVGYVLNCWHCDEALWKVWWGFFVVVVFTNLVSREFTNLAEMYASVKQTLKQSPCIISKIFMGQSRKYFKSRTTNETGNHKVKKSRRWTAVEFWWVRVKRNKQNLTYDVHPCTRNCDTVL